MTEKEQLCRICLLPLDEYSMGEKNGYQLVACKTCGSVMVKPWIKQADLDKFFGDIQPEIVHLANPTARIWSLKKLIQKISPTVSGRRFLDVSCRQGYTVTAAKELGFQALGIDSHDFFIAFARDKFNADLFECVSMVEYATRLAQAEVIFSIESFCEQADPDAYMAALSKVLAPGGVLYLQEPDGNHFTLPRNFSRWAFVDPPLNFVYPSVKGMTALLDRHGFKIHRKLRHGARTVAADC
ncbi:MAG: class I SAM-dependent methyltransferase [Proteobacteria bacterium]|nr:class I SAM-dependent methyltransferase [Pseudomonadota bacterium]